MTEPITHPLHRYTYMPDGKLKLEDVGYTHEDVLSKDEEIARLQRDLEQKQRYWDDCHTNGIVSKREFQMIADEVQAAEKEIARLRAVIESAPHPRECAIWVETSSFPQYESLKQPTGTCDCWKRGSAIR